MRLRGLSRNIIALGWVSFLNDIASEMLYPVIPIFLMSLPGATTELLGLIEGVAEGGGSILRWVAGAFSDRFRRRKPFVVAGYGLSAISKPVMGLAAYAIGWPLIFVGRSGDRLGKSVRTSARDALIADSTDRQHYGMAFGFHRAMDSAGAVLGPLAALAIVSGWPHFRLAWIFFVALLPGVISTLVAWVWVRDIPRQPHPGAKPPSLWQSYPASFWIFILATAIFTLGNSSDAFLLLRSKQLGLSFASVVLAYALFSFVFTATALPLGRLSDRVGRKPVIAAGWLLFAVVYLGFSAARSGTVVWGLLAIYGVYQALTDGVTKALISDVVDPRTRAGAIGLFYTVTGCCQLAANLITGRLWTMLIAHRFQAGLLTGAIGAIAAVPILLAIPVRQHRPAVAAAAGGK